MLRRMCAERPKDWDKDLPALLFAIREVPQESLEKSWPIPRILTVLSTTFQMYDCRANGATTGGQDTGH